MDWFCSSPNDGGIWHVYPCDGREHATEVDDVACWCDPQVERVAFGGVMVIHAPGDEVEEIAAGCLRPH